MSEPNGLIEHEWIGQTYLSTFGWNVLETIVDIRPRMGGTPGEKKAQERVERAFQEAGLRDVDYHTFDMPGWDRGSSSLTLRTPVEDELECIALPGTPSASLSGEVIHLGHGLPRDFEAADVEGRLVVCRSDVPDWYDHWMHRREKYGLAIEHGAAGFIFANHVPGCLPPTGSLGGGMDVIGPLPGIGISMEAGERIARYAQKGPVEADIDIDVEIGPTTSQNVTGRLGPDTDREIILCAHVDGHDISEGASDNGAGVAILCETARALGQIESTLRTGVRFIGFGAEELGLVGSQHWVNDHDPQAVKVVLNLDGIGRGRNLRVHTNHFPGFEQPVAALADTFRHPVAALPEFVPHSDHWPFVCAGVPGAMLTSEAKERGRGYGHTHADTLDKVDIRELREHAILVTRLTQQLAAPEVSFEHKAPADVRQLLIEQNYDGPLALARDLPFDDEH